MAKVGVPVDDLEKVRCAVVGILGPSKLVVLEERDVVEELLLSQCQLPGEGSDMRKRIRLVKEMRMKAFSDLLGSYCHVQDNTCEE